MIEKLIEASIRNRFLVLILAAGLSVAGLYAVFDRSEERRVGKEC